MSSKKCMTCGLVNGAAETVCKRCGAAVTDTSHLSFAPKSGRAEPVSAYPGSPFGFISSQVRRCNRNLLVANLCLSAAVLVALLLSGKYYYNFCFGPFPMTEETLTSLRNADQTSHRFVVIPIDNAIDYSVEEFETRSNGRERVVAAYYSLMFGEKLLLVKAPPGHHEPQFSGYLENMSGYHRGQREVLEQFVAHDPGSRGAYLPVMLDATDVRTPGWIGLAIGLPLFILGAWNIKRALTRRSNPSAHPILLSLEKYGSPITIAAAIDREINAETSQPTGSVSISSSWLLNARLFTLDARPLVEIVWAYKKVTRHSVNFIPTGKTYVTVVWDRRRKSMEISTSRSEQKTHRILEALAARAPWVLIGYSEDLAQDWRADAAGVISTVDQRRDRINREQAETNESNPFPGTIKPGSSEQANPRTTVEIGGHQQVHEVS